MKPRDYQREARVATFGQLKDSASTLVVMATGCGKTIFMADFIRSVFPHRAMVLAHREELIFQAAEKIRAFTGFRCDIEMAGHRAELGGMFGHPQVVVSSIQTQVSGADGSGRMTRFDPTKFGYLFIDECHHAPAGSYKKAIAYYRQNPNLKVVGVTATPDRSDEKALGQIFDTVAFEYDILKAVSNGWLVEPLQQVVSVEGLDFSACRTTAGDLNGKDLAAVMEYEENLHRLATPTLELTRDKRTIVFASSVHHAERLAEIFNRHREGCAGWVCGKTDKDERRKTLADFSSGKLQYVVNVGVLTEGFDDHGVECIVMGKPTMSRSLYTQMVGRATRPVPGIDAHETSEARLAYIAASSKPNCTIYDFAGNSGKHKLVSLADALSGDMTDDVIELATAMARKAAGAVSIVKALDAAREQIAKDAERAKMAAAARRMKLTARADYNTQTVSPFDAFALSPVQERGWQAGKELSEKQKSMLQKQGISPDKLTFAQGKQLIAEIFRRWDNGLCSYKQATILSKHGIDATNTTREQASEHLDRIFGKKRSA